MTSDSKSSVSGASQDSGVQVNVPDAVRTFLAAPDHNAITRDLANNMHHALSSMPHTHAQALVKSIIDIIKDDAFRGRFLKVLGSHIHDHPRQSVFFILGVALMLNPLNLLGFGALGPVAGSLAAAWQASIGSVAAGSLFAILQSAGMVGAITIPLAGAGITAMAVLAPWGAIPVGPQRWLSGDDGSPVTDWAQGKYGNPVEKWVKGEYGSPITSWWKGDYGNPVSAWWSGSLGR